MMEKLRRAGTAPLVMLAATILAAAPYPARSEETATQGADAAGCHRSAFRIVVDVGHTVDSPGADSARGVTEYTFNLQLADAIKQALLDSGFDKTIRLVTTTGHVPGLLERAERANNMHADLFIAVHHDSVPDNLIEKWEFEGQQHQFSDRFKGYSIFISHDNGDYKGSLEFGQLLGTALQARGLQYTSHYTLPVMGKHRRELVDAVSGVYQYDQLIVLRFTHMPAVLLEAGSIVNRQEELELATPERRARTSAAVAAAVEDFCVSRSRAISDLHIKRPPQPNTAAPTRAKPASLTRRLHKQKDFPDRE
jgi:N-acetylmuramoyl-L-alanine amidase